MALSDSSSDSSRPRDNIAHLPSAVPAAVNQGVWLTAYTLPELAARATEPDWAPVLPLCRTGTSAAALEQLGPLVLPPLFLDAMDRELREFLLARVHEGFPYLVGTRQRGACSAKLRVVELNQQPAPPDRDGGILAFSVDTAVEQHGPQLPLATDTIQSYGVLGRLAAEFPQLTVSWPADYGHLTWGLPYGMSIDITPAGVTRYVAGLARALDDHYRPQALYVVDVHGSPVHRAAIEEGLRQSGVERFAFRWLYEPLVEFAGSRGDQHAGGVETAIVEHISSELVDGRWWPGRADDLAAGQLTMARAIELSDDLDQFVEEVDRHGLNGIVGDIHNYREVDGGLMFRRMVDLAREDVRRLLAG